MGAVAPHDSWQRGLKPPELPGAADDLARLSVDACERLRFLVLEAVSFISIHAAQPENIGHQVLLVRKRSAGGGNHIEIAAGIDYHISHDCLTARFRLADYAADAVVFDDSAGKPAVQPRLDTRFAHHLSRDTLPAIRVKGRRIADGGRLCTRVEIEQAPPCPLSIMLRRGCPFMLRRDHGQALALHPVN